jgi:uncharacterized YigZ family protein
LEKILTIDKEFKEIYKEKGSSFIAHLFPLNDIEDYKEILNNLKKEYYDATHHCYALKFGNEFKYSDDGEPNGTAGIRILNAIEHYNLDNVFIVVVRYFGGVKLGVGGLGKAYYEASEMVIQTAEIIEKYAYKTFQVEFSFDDTSKIYHKINQLNGNILNTNYTEDKIIIDFEILYSYADKVNDIFEDMIYKIKINNNNTIIYK